MKQHLIILNRTAADASATGWIHIVPKGELPNREAGITQVLDDESLDSILRNISTDKQRQGDKWPGIYAGREHFIYNDDQDSAALAWFKDFEKRPDGIWAKDDGLTDIGREVIKNGHYKFTSFVADRRDTQNLGNKRYRILKLDTVGFTNNANGKELLSPITNRAAAMTDCLDCKVKLNADQSCPDCKKNFAGAGASADSEDKTNQKSKMKNIATKLGLSADASEDSILTEVTKLQNRITTLEPLEAKNTELKNRVAEQDGEQVDGLLVTHNVKDEKVRNRLKPVLLGLKNRDDRAAYLIDFGFKPVDASKGNQTRVLNRNDGNGGQQQEANVDANDPKLAQKIRNRAEALKATHPGASFDARWALATEEINAGK